MKFAEPLESQRLSFLLEKAASREALMWKVYVPKKPSPGSQDTDISPAQRDEAVCWLINLHKDTKLYPETLSLAISILDRFLGTIKARPKYLRCIAIACYFLAAKTSEEDERVPIVGDLASSSRCGCSPSEILRMERIILDKLNWDLHAATPLEFLHIFHAMVLSCKPRFMVGLVGCNPAQHLSVLTQQLHYCLADSALLQPLSRGSMLALALITLELENICPDWLALTINLLRKTQIDSSQLIRCRELVSRHLSTQEASLPPNTVYIYQSLHHSLDPDPCTRGRESDTRLPDRDPPAPSTAPRDRSLSWVSSTTLLQVHGPPKPSHHSHQVSLRCKHSAKRKVEEMEVDEFYEGIKRLYNEENGGAPEGTAVTGEEPLEESPVLLVRREGHTSPCPPLQPVSVS
ncbi:LOW QUALITY PROTEIN: cyclin-I-like [Oncorhynchus keta]|uniref:LOW QUALITY PROTEIN: cyclin-I-like n=1 Tax=Oncorhynchus keta TaxID=8018 RepID=UPI00227BD2E0|nr:LOW QUALITY PROTEIN: cyclin-I-like [Oncorhynchus keta]